MRRTPDPNAERGIIEGQKPPPADDQGRAAAARSPQELGLPLSRRNGRAIGIGVTDPRAIVGVSAVVLLLSACGILDPYLYRPGEFNRESVEFNTEPADITEVSVCYQGLLTSRETVFALAEQRCAEFDRTAEFISTRYGQCPLLTSAQARFACIRP